MPVDAVLCGHIHSASIREFGAVTYYNCGDWVETCSALIENLDGKIEMVSCSPFAGIPAVEEIPLAPANLA